MAEETKSDPPPTKPAISIIEEADAAVKESSGSGDTFVFEASPRDPLPSLDNREAKDLLAKWDLKDFFQAKRFRFGKRFNPADLSTFLLDLFNDPTVRSELKVASTRREMMPLTGSATAVNFSRLPATQLSMTFFDRLEEEGIIRDNGSLWKDYLPDAEGGVPVNDHLRDLLLNGDDSEHEGLFSDAKKDEFLFQLLRLFAIGGSMCQYEDLAAPYLDTVKAAYKDLLTVTKNAAGRLSISSTVVSVSGLDGTDVGLFPNDLPYSACFVVIDAGTRVATVVYNAFVPFW